MLLYDFVFFVDGLQSFVGIPVDMESPFSHSLGVFLKSWVTSAYMAVLFWATWLSGSWLER